MELFDNILLALIIEIGICIAIIILLPIITKILDNRNTMEYEEGMRILNLIIAHELQAYEADVFNKKTTITNSNFDTYYKDLSRKIINNISPKLISNLSKFITEDHIYVIISRDVKMYLASKIYQ